MTTDGRPVRGRRRGFRRWSRSPAARLPTWCAPLWAASAARADDWPQWLGPQRDGVWREKGLVDKFPPGGPKALWRVPVAAGYGGPAVADGRVYLMDRQRATDADGKPARP